MKAYKYKKTDKLPKSAIIVSQYASDNNISVGYVYMKFKRGKADYDIINYQGINFVIPGNVAKAV